MMQDAPVDPDDLPDNVSYHDKKTKTILFLGPE